MKRKSNGTQFFLNQMGFALTAVSTYLCVINEQIELLLEKRVQI